MIKAEKTKCECHFYSEFEGCISSKGCQLQPKLRITRGEIDIFLEQLNKAGGLYKVKLIDFLKSKGFNVVEK